MQRLWRSALWGILARSCLCGPGSIVHRREPRDGSTPSEDARLQHCGCHDKAHRAATCKIRQSVKYSRLHALQLAVEGMAIEQGTQGAMSENCARDGREPPGRNGLHDLVGRQAFARRASTKELHNLLAL